MKTSVAYKSTKKFLQKTNNMDGAATAWNELSYLDGILFTVWLGILYYGKCWMDNYFKNKHEESKY